MRSPLRTRTTGSMGYFLAGDIGGTQTRLGIFAPRAMDPKRDAPRCIGQVSFNSGEISDFYETLERFLANLELSFSGGCLAVAGPVVEHSVHFTNLPWSIDAREVSLRLGAPVTLINDVAAAALGITALRPDESTVIQAGAPSPGPRIALSVGTGLGAALLVPDGAGWRALPSEAGHIGFAPRNARQRALLDYARGVIGERVTVERVASGSALGLLYAFLSDTEDHLEDPEIGRAVRADLWAAGSTIGQHQDDPLCAAVLRLLVEILGGVAGDLVLTTMATGGVYLTGGIPPKIEGPIHGGFTKPFCNKGQHARLLRDTPVHLVRNEQLGLIGAARHARGMK